MIFIKMEMNRTAEIFFGSFIMVSLIVMAIDTLVIIAAARDNSQHNTRFCIIGNISLADLVTIAITDIILIDIISEGKLELDLFMLVICTIAGVAHLVSILSNLFLSIDRFIAVKFVWLTITLLSREEFCFQYSCVGYFR